MTSKKLEISNNYHKELLMSVKTHKSIPRPGDVLATPNGIPASLVTRPHKDDTTMIMAYAHHDPSGKWHLSPLGCVGGLTCVILPESRDRLLEKCGGDVKQADVTELKVVRWSRQGLSLFCELVDPQ